MLKHWIEMNAFSFAPEAAVALLCVGSCEQHSEYLPLGTDGYLGECIAADAAKKASADVWMLPTQRFGFSPHHRAFAGCITLSQQTMFSYYTEVCMGAFQNGVRKLLILNAHGGNQSCLQTVVNELGSVHGKKAVLVRYWDLIGDFVARVRKSGPGGMGHAGEFETSLMLHYHPELVRKERIGIRAPAEGNSWHGPDMFAKNKVYIYKPFDEYSDKGNIGQPQFASAKEGEAIAGAASDELAKLIDFYATHEF